MEIADLGAKIALGLISILLAMYAIIQRHRADRFAQEVARNQGAFSRSMIEVHPFAQAAGETSDFIFGLPLATAEIINFPLQLLIRNTGDKTAVDIEMLFRTSKELLFGGKVEYEMISSGAKGMTFHSTNEDGAYKTMAGASLDD